MALVLGVRVGVGRRSLAAGLVGRFGFGWGQGRAKAERLSHWAGLCWRWVGALACVSGRARGQQRALGAVHATALLCQRGLRPPLSGFGVNELREATPWLGVSEADRSALEGDHGVLEYRAVCVCVVLVRVECGIGA